MAQDLPRVVGFPGFAGSLGRELPVEADGQVDQLATHGPDAERVRQVDAGAEIFQEALRRSCQRADHDPGGM